MSELHNNDTSRMTRVLDQDVRDGDIGNKDTGIGDGGLRDANLRDESASEESRRFLGGSGPDRTAPVSPGDPDRPAVATLPQTTHLTEGNSDGAAHRDMLASGSLFPEDELHHFRARWDQVQASFVDKPQDAVEAADSLVGNVVKRITEQFAEERNRLEGQWKRGENVSTEELRQGFRRYRFLFDRLLTLQPNTSDAIDSTHATVAGR